MSATDLASDEEQAYFLALEQAFIQLRGVGLYFSELDRQHAVEWYQAGIPLAIVVRGLEAAFAKRKTKKGRKQLISLHYCAPAIEKLWEETRRLAAAGITVEPASFATPPRLAALAAALPPDLPEVESWRARLLALEGESETVEPALAELDRELVERLLTLADPAEIEAQITRALRNLASRLPAEELGAARSRMASQIVRQRWRLPVLSLFAPEAGG